jgi:hypothetical protein
MESGDAGDFENRLLRPTNLTALGSDSSKLLSGLLTDLRQTVVLALAAGVPPKVVSEQLGHASTAFTLETYPQLLKQRVRKSGCRASTLQLDRLRTACDLAEPICST